MSCSPLGPPIMNWTDFVRWATPEGQDESGTTAVWGKINNWEAQWGVMGEILIAQFKNLTAKLKNSSKVVTRELEYTDSTAYNQLHLAFTSGFANWDDKTLYQWLGDLCGEDNTLMESFYVRVRAHMKKEVSLGHMVPAPTQMELMS